MDELLELEKQMEKLKEPGQIMTKEAKFISTDKGELTKLLNRHGIEKVNNETVEQTIERIMKEHADTVGEDEILKVINVSKLDTFVDAYNKTQKLMESKYSTIVAKLEEVSSSIEPAEQELIEKLKASGKYNDFIKDDKITDVDRLTKKLDTEMGMAKTRYKNLSVGDNYYSDLKRSKWAEGRTDEEIRAKADEEKRRDVEQFEEASSNLDTLNLVLTGKNSIEKMKQELNEIKGDFIKSSNKVKNSLISCGVKETELNEADFNKLDEERAKASDSESIVTDTKENDTASEIDGADKKIDDETNKMDDTDKEKSDAIKSEGEKVKSKNNVSIPGPAPVIFPNSKNRIKEENELQETSSSERTYELERAQALQEKLNELLHQKNDTNKDEIEAKVNELISSHEILDGVYNEEGEINFEYDMEEALKEAISDSKTAGRLVDNIVNANDEQKKVLMEKLSLSSKEFEKFKSDLSGENRNERLEKIEKSLNGPLGILKKISKKNRRMAKYIKEIRKSELREFRDKAYATNVRLLNDSINGNENGNLTAEEAKKVSLLGYQIKKGAACFGFKQRKIAKFDFSSPVLPVANTSPAVSGNSPTASAPAETDLRQKLANEVRTPNEIQNAPSNVNDIMAFANITNRHAEAKRKNNGAR